MIPVTSADFYDKPRGAHRGIVRRGMFQGRRHLYLPGSRAGRLMARRARLRLDLIEQRERKTA